MSVSSVGPSSYFHQVSASAGAQPPEKAPSAEAVKEQDEARAKRMMTPEEEEARRKTLAGMATKEFRDILAEDAQRREAQGMSPTGVVVDVSA